MKQGPLGRSGGTIEIHAERKEAQTPAKAKPTIEELYQAVCVFEANSGRSMAKAKLLINKAFDNMAQGLSYTEEGREALAEIAAAASAFEPKAQGAALRNMAVQIFIAEDAAKGAFA